MRTRLTGFVGGRSGTWRVVVNRAVCGDPLSEVTHLEIQDDAAASPPPSAAWVLRGITSNERYVTRAEKTELAQKQPSLGRSNATCAALIPIKKSAAWWGLTQDERRRIFEDQSMHIRTGMLFLPAVARRLHHCRDLSPTEPFDFLTWFEYAPEHAPAFEDLTLRLRASPEWEFVEREVDLRLVGCAAPP